MAILAHASDGSELLCGEIEMDESYFGGRRKGPRGRGAANKVPVFGILERNGVVKVETLRNVTAPRTLLDLTIKTVRRGSIVYTDKFKSYDSLMFCGYRHIKIDHKQCFASGKVYINGAPGILEFFRKSDLLSFMVSPEIKEMEFRYNNRDNEIFELMVKSLCNFVPKRL